MHWTIKWRKLQINKYSPSIQCYKVLTYKQTSDAQEILQPILSYSLFYKYRALSFNREKKLLRTGEIVIIENVKLPNHCQTLHQVSDGMKVDGEQDYKWADNIITTQRYNSQLGWQQAILSNKECLQDQAK